MDDRQVSKLFEKIGEVSLDVRATSKDVHQLQEQTDELCKRLGHVESEIIGEIGNPEKRSIRSQHQEFKAALAALGAELAGVRTELERVKGKRSLLAAVARALASAARVVLVLFTGGAVAPQKG